MIHKGEQGWLFMIQGFDQKIILVNPVNPVHRFCALK